MLSRAWWLLPRLLLLHLLRSPLTTSASSLPTPRSTTPWRLTGCPGICGDVSIPYPFGVGEICSRPGFEITCNNTHYNPPAPFIGNIPILGISVATGGVRVSLDIARDCYSKSGEKLDKGYNMLLDLTRTPYSISAELNSFVAVGCDTDANYVPSGGVGGGCSSICGSIDNVTNDGTCSGVGCCRAPLPRGLKYYRPEIRSYHNHTRVWDFNPCSYAFVRERNSNMFFTSILTSNYADASQMLPAFLDWSIEDDKTCEAAKRNASYACVSPNSDCLPSNNGHGYLCACSDGYDGNPYIPYGCQVLVKYRTLHEHLHSGDSSLSWDDRLRIATESTAAISYLHSAATVSIFHRDVKSSNILLDDAFTAKVSDFGASKSMELDQTRLTTVVQGTFGYLDPEYFQTSKLTQKSDVYSMGVILVELLTGQKPISNCRSEEDRNLISHFLCSFKENRLFEVLDARVAEDGEKEELESVARLAEMCLRLKGEERPTMKEVEERLGRLRRFKKLRHVARNYEEAKSNEETERLLQGSISVSICRENSTGQHSFQSQPPLSWQDFPR